MTVGAVLCDTAQPTVYAVVSIAQNLKSQKPKKSFQYVSLGFPPKKCQVVKIRQPARLSLLFPGFPKPGAGPPRGRALPTLPWRRGHGQDGSFFRSRGGAGVVAASSSSLRSSSSRFPLGLRVGRWRLDLGMSISWAGECRELPLLDTGACLGPPPRVPTRWDTAQAGSGAAAGAINSFGGRD